MHEQSETVGRDGKFYNVYGANTPKAGQVLPGEPAYNTLKEAVTAAENRSEQYGHTHNPEGNKMADESTVPPAVAKQMEFERQDRRNAAAAAKAPTTKTSMGEGRLFGSAGEDEQAAQNRREINRLPAKKLVRGGGIESRGKTKGRFV